MGQYPRIILVALPPFSTGCTPPHQCCRLLPILVGLRSTPCLHHCHWGSNNFVLPSCQFQLTFLNSSVSPAPCPAVGRACHGLCFGTPPPPPPRVSFLNFSNGAVMGPAPLDPILLPSHFLGQPWSLVLAQECVNRMRIDQLLNLVRTGCSPQRPCC
jgi:hypothetical protein